MKTLFTLLFILVMFPLVSYASDNSDIQNNNQKVALLTKAAPIEDEFVKSNAFPKIMPAFIKQNDPIVDEIIVPYEKSGTTLKLWARKTGEVNKVTIDDELITPKFISKVGGISILKRHKKTVIEDSFAQNNAHKNKIGKTKVKNKYDFSKAQIPVQLKIIKNLSTKHNISEGDSILFKTVKDVDLNGKYIPKGTQVIGRVETISESDKMGCPANIAIDNFHLKDNPDICLYGNVSRTGANRAIWVYPLYQAGNLIFYVAGFVFVPIHGGHAKLLTKDTYTVYYETGVVGNSNITPATSN